MTFAWCLAFNRVLDCNSWPNSSLLIFVFKQKIDETNFRTFFKGKIAKKQSRNIGLNPMHTFPAVSELLSYQLSKNWLTWLPLSTFKKIWIEMRLKSADTLEDRKKWRQKICLWKSANWHQQNFCQDFTTPKLLSLSTDSTTVYWSLFVNKSIIVLITIIIFQCHFLEWSNQKLDFHLIWFQAEIF